MTNLNYPAPPHTLKCIVEITNTGLSAYLEEFDGVVAVGANLSELKLAMAEAVQHHLEYQLEKGILTGPISPTRITYFVDLEQFFGYYKILNKTALARYAGINPSLFRQYTTGLTPVSGKKMKQISAALRRVAEDLAGLELA